MFAETRDNGGSGQGLHTDSYSEYSRCMICSPKKAFITFYTGMLSSNCHELLITLVLFCTALWFYLL